MCKPKIEHDRNNQKLFLLPTNNFTYIFFYLESLWFFCNLHFFAYLPSFFCYSLFSFMMKVNVSRRKIHRHYCIYIKKKNKTMKIFKHTANKLAWCILFFTPQTWNAWKNTYLSARTTCSPCTTCSSSEYIISSFFFFPVKTYSFYSSIGKYLLWIIGKLNSEELHPQSQSVLHSATQN